MSYEQFYRDLDAKNARTVRAARLILAVAGVGLFFTICLLGGVVSALLIYALSAGILAISWAIATLVEPPR